MTEYHVMWEIEVEASSPEEAALLAREIQLDPNSSATVFHVAKDLKGIQRVDTEELPCLTME